VAIPVIVLTGFLGAGKTTLLNHLLRTSSGTRVGVVANDFGAVNIDAMAVAGQVDSMVSLSNGCVCCVTDEGGLDDVLGVLARTNAPVDVIVVEASGLAEPQAVVRQVLGSNNRHVEYGGLVQVVDAVEFEQSRARHAELDKHVRIADLVVLNKCDRLTESELSRVLGVVTDLADGAAVVTTSHGQVNPALLFDPHERPKPAQLSFDDLDDHSDHVHAVYQSAEFDSEQPLNPRLLVELLNGRPAGVFRIKGFVHFGQRGKYTLHVVGGFLKFTMSNWGRGEPRRTRLVLIGSGADMDSVLARLAECARQSVEDGDMYAVLRYTQS
jgi:G3E family GTPase